MDDGGQQSLYLINKYTKNIWLQCVSAVPSFLAGVVLKHERYSFHFHGFPKKYVFRSDAHNKSEHQHM
jgi:hypothetical protein